MVKHGLNPQNGFKFEELVIGGLYECRLSGRPILIKAQTKKPFKVAVCWNELQNQYENFYPTDHQLKYPSK